MDEALSVFDAFQKCGLGRRYKDFVGAGSKLENRWEVEVTERLELEREKGRERFN